MTINYKCRSSQLDLSNEFTISTGKVTDTLCIGDFASYGLDGSSFIVEGRKMLELAG